MNDMYVMNATDARREWSLVVDRAVRERPQFIKRTRTIFFSGHHAYGEYSFRLQIHGTNTP